MPSGVRDQMNFGNTNVIVSNQKYETEEPLDHSARAHYLISRGYVKGMTVEQLVERLKKDNQ